MKIRNFRIQNDDKNYNNYITIIIRIMMIAKMIIFHQNDVKAT